MRLLFFGLFWASISFAGPKAEVSQQKSFGGAITQKEVTTLADVVTNFDKYQDKVVAFEATPKKVCKKSGCWMVLEDGDKVVRTLFKDYGFFVPANIVGKKVRVQGQMTKKKVSAATLRHYLKDEGKKMSEIRKIKTGQMKFQFVADAVQVL